MNFRALFLLLLVPGLFSAQATDAPNIIVMLADDMGFGDLSINGSPAIETPHIDALANSGANFTSAYASANICTPSRAGLLTGRYPIRSGMGWEVIVEDDESGLPLAEITIAELLQEAGYATGMVGKWHLGNRAPYWPTQQGFDSFFGVQHSNDMPNFALFRDETVIEQPVDQSTLTRRYTREAIQFIEANRDRPFFLYLAHTFPHIPLVVAEDRQGKSEAGLYGDVVEELDWSTGKIIEALKALELVEDTIVIFTSDNGAWFEGSGSASRGRKGETWDGAFHVPLTVTWPKRVRVRQTVKAPVMNIDILPTMVAAAGARIPSDRTIDGRNLLPIVTGGKQSGPHEYLYFFTNEDIVAVRSGRWKLVTHTYYRQRLAALENVEVLHGFDAPYLLLFDMEGPTAENYSLAREYPDIVERLHSEMRAARRRFDAYRTRPPLEVYPPKPLPDD